MESKERESSTEHTNLINNAIGARIKEKRKSLKITQKQLAIRINKAESSIQKYEGGSVEIPFSVLQEIAKELHTTTSYLLGHENIQKKYNENQLFKQQLKQINCYYDFIGGFNQDSYVHENDKYAKYNNIHLNTQVDDNTNLHSEGNVQDSYYLVTYNDFKTKVPAIALKNLQEESKSYLKFKLQELINKYQE